MNVRDGVSKTVKTDYLTGHHMIEHVRQQTVKPFWISNGRAELGRLHAKGQVRGGRGEDVAAMKRAAHAITHEPLLPDLMDCGLRFIQDKAEETVIRPHERVPVPDQHDRLPRTPHAGIDHAQMDRAGREVRIVFGEKETRLPHILCFHFMGDIDDCDARVYRKHDPFHDADIGVFQAEISEDRYGVHVSPAKRSS
ncbi:MAG: hypothetical protein A4E57_04866 [Syntrophorhabdaceae bacterium PtaU1.Bin034]|nr:MAG: hypothetical protein A4E57_04866 [Syntrophorhabdaceae bacterium PtaU1.Bin034]